jgi:hypothetical protein
MKALQIFINKELQPREKKKKREEINCWSYKFSSSHAF